MIIEAILKINPNALVIVRGENIDDCDIEWLDGTTKIAKKTIKETMNTLIEEKKNNKASEKQKLQDLGLTLDEIQEAFNL